MDEFTWQIESIDAIPEQYLTLGEAREALRRLAARGRAYAYRAFNPEGVQPDIWNVWLEVTSERLTTQAWQERYNAGDNSAPSAS